MKCARCKYELAEHEYFVKLKDGSVVDENCFFDLALVILGATSEHNEPEEE